MPRQIYRTRYCSGFSFNKMFISILPSFNLILSFISKYDKNLFYLVYSLYNLYKRTEEHIKFIVLVK